MELPPLYIIDASSLIKLARHRSPGRYARMWQRLDELIRNERLISAEEVYVELKQGTDALVEWTRKYRKENRLFRRTTRQLAGIARQLISEHPNLVDIDRPVAQADPFVIALAISESKRDMFPPPCTVVTEEVFNYSGNPKLPNVCGHCMMPYLTIHQMFIKEGWAF
jgi:hypothetical protein